MDRQQVLAWANEKSVGPNVIVPFVQFIDANLPNVSGDVMGGGYYRWAANGASIAALYLTKKYFRFQFRIQPSAVRVENVSNFVPRPSEPSKRSDWTEIRIPYEDDYREALTWVCGKLREKCNL